MSRQRDAGSSERREFSNPYPVFEKQNSNIVQNGNLSEPFSTSVNESISRLLGQLESGLRRDCDENDQSVYTGVTGISLLYLQLYNVYKREEYLCKGYEFIKGPLQRLKRRRFTFMCGDAGPLAVGAVLHDKMGRKSESQDCIKKLQGMYKDVLDPGLPDELLYGRVGYLYALLFLQRHLGAGRIDAEIVDKVCQCILDSGQRLARKEGSPAPLMFEWHEKKYLGAAHGLAGIMTILMQAKSPVVTQSLRSLIKPTVDYILTLAFPSGNFPSSLGNSSDRLVHWCHGAPGVVHMLLQAHKVYGEEKYLTAARNCGKVIWERGILRKGYGLCHGTAGNAYAFLTLYQTTNEDLYLHNAGKFAEWCMDYGKHGCRIADRPYSLMEGLAGTIYLLTDLLHPSEARFPGL